MTTFPRTRISRLAAGPRTAGPLAGLVLAALLLAPRLSPAEPAPGPAAGTGASAAAAQPPQTVIDCSGRADMVSTDTETEANFHDNVVVTGNNMVLTCDDLKVIAYRKGDPRATLGKYGNFKTLLATGHVRIVQADRVATCGRAEVFPGEERMVLTENPVITSENPHSVASGPRMILLRGQRRAIIEGTPTQRTHIILPPVKDMGFHDQDSGAGTEPSGEPSSGPSADPVSTGTTSP